MPVDPSSGRSEPGSFDSGAVTVWAQYAKERYDAQEKRLSDCRSSARQLAAGMGVVVGVEAALMAQVLKLGEAGGSVSWVGCLLILLLVIAYQLLILARAVGVGYVGRELLAAESPVVLAEHLAGKDEAWARQTIGAYYAKGADNVHAVAEAVVKDVGIVAERFRVSLALLFLMMVLTCGLKAISDTRNSMTDTPTSPGPVDSSPVSVPAPAPTQTPAPPTPASPLLVTPTPGQSETRGTTPPRETLVSTPGQTLTGAFLPSRSDLDAERSHTPPSRAWVGCEEAEAGAVRGRGMPRP